MALKSGVTSLKSVSRLGMLGEVLKDSADALNERVIYRSRKTG
jgi:hypothetical protein